MLEMSKLIDLAGLLYLKSSMKRTCKKCKALKDLQKDFYINGYYKDMVYYDHCCKECKKEYCQKWNKKAAAMGYHKKRYLKRKEEGILWERGKRKGNGKTAYQWKLNNPDRARILRLRFQQRQRDELRTALVKSRINRQFGLKFSEITLEMVRLKRAQIFLYREIKKAKEVINEPN